MANICSLTNPLSSVTETLLTQISQVCLEQKIPFFIAGATAREILLHHVHGKSIGRRTRDIDIAIFVDEWRLFDLLKKSMSARGAIEDKKSHHRMYWQHVELDIIPFGGIAQENQIFWPPDREIILSVDGFTEVFAYVIPVKLDNAVVIPFCSLPGLTLLKLFAWRDRGHATAKDAADLYKIITEYGAIEDARLYELPVEGENYGWDPVRMGAGLLGHDIASMSSNESTDALRQLDKEKLIDAIVRAVPSEATDKIVQLVDDLWSGIFAQI